MSKKDIILRIVLLVIFAFIITLLAWQSDDAYHGYVMAKHLAQGEGFVYNAGQRANASTGPVYTLIIALAYMITKEMFFTSIAVNVIFSTAALGLILFFICRSKEQMLFAFAALTGSAAFVSYTTSGLENCLLFFLCMLFYRLYWSKEKFERNQMLALALILAFLATARMDAVLYLVPPIVYVFLKRRRDVTFLEACILTPIGLLPFILWELFSFFYYGFWVPNTAFVKLGAGISTVEYMKKGVWYVYYTLINDPMVILIPALFVVLSFIGREIKSIMASLGILLYGAYIIYIGGDFMMGRHFTVMHIIAVAGIIQLMNDMAGRNFRFSGICKNAFSIAVVACLVLAGTLGAGIGREYLVNGKYAPGGAISDERAYYSPTTGFYSNVRSLMKEGRMCIEDTWNYQAPDELRAQGVPGGILDNAAGILVYYNSDLYLNDTYCLGDPFLSKLPAIKQDTWRVGHLKRQVPAGYRESVMYGGNRIEDEKLAQYYDIICEMTKGELFSMERLKTVIAWNMGKYDYLLE